MAANASGPFLAGHTRSAGSSSVHPASGQGHVEASNTAREDLSIISEPPSIQQFQITPLIRSTFDAKDLRLDDPLSEAGDSESEDLEDEE